MAGYRTATRHLVEDPAIVTIELRTNYNWITLSQGDAIIQIGPAAVPALIEALQAAAREAATHEADLLSERAAQADATGHDTSADFSRESEQTARGIAAAISALANQDHLAEVQALRAERDALLALRSAIAVKGGSEHYPTEEAYLLACAAIEKHRASAAAALAEVARLKGKAGDAAQALMAIAHTATSIDEARQIARAALTPKGDTP